MTEPLRLMAILAHPDDESLGIGGTLARYAKEGVETHLVTATRGERGRCGHLSARPSDAEVGRIREGELLRAAKVLGIRSVAFLDYLDGDLSQADTAEATRRVARHILSVRPHVVISFGPEGAYGHPDHIAISQLATAGVFLAAAEGHCVSKLYYLAWDRDKWDAYQAAFKELTSQVDGVVRRALPWADWALTTRVDTGAEWSTVWRAVTSHQSQMAAYQTLSELDEVHHTALWGTQTFYRAMSLVNGGPGVESDLFEGLR